MARKASDIRRFSAVIEPASGGGAFVTIPFDVEEVFGAKRVKVIATFDGVEYRGSIVRMGSPDWFLIVRKDVRQKIGKEPGDEVDVTVRKDAEPRVIQAPADVRKALKKAGLAETFDRLSFTHKREFVQWIEEAKKPETRERRIAKTVEMVGEGKSR